MADVIARLQHRNVSDDGTAWEYEVRGGIRPPQPLIIARVILGGRLFDIEIPVCSSRKPRPFSWSIRHMGEGQWRISGARYGARRQGHDVEGMAVEVEMTQPAAFEEGMPVGSLDLLGAPPHILAELLAIDDVPTK